MKKTVIVCLSIYIICIANIFACTTAVISGKATTDGRPIIWKLRDTDYLKNYYKYYERTPNSYALIGLINSIDTLGLEVWGGSNEKGFAIMNSASFNVNLSDTSHYDNQEGYFMKEALERCATLQDFEALLNNRKKPMGLASHFGVIDANGGAAFYEVNNYTWTKFDANDPKVAPDGYILRTNFSETGKPNIGYGFVRLETAKQLFEKAATENNINYKTIIQHFSRCLYNPITKNNYRNMYEDKAPSDDFIHSDNLITSWGSASNIVIQGVLPTEDCSMNTIWTMVGFPNTCITIPLWTTTEEALPEVIKYDKAIKNCKLNNYSLEWMHQCYPINNPDGYHYLKISKLVNNQKTGFIQLIEPVENNLFALTDKQLTLWRKKRPQTNQVKNFYNQIDQLVYDLYKH